MTPARALFFDNGPVFILDDWSEWRPEITWEEACKLWKETHTSDAPVA
jgi:hypothetical protein